jgi:hypothetical protein
MAMRPSVFIRAMHPKTEIRPDTLVIRRILQSGWVGQIKIHGHRAQIHISADPDEPILVYNRQGQLHKQELSPKMEKELRRIFAPEREWTVLDAEWLKPEQKIFVFDVLKQDGRSLSRLTYLERYKLLPRNFISPVVSVLGLIDDVDRCLEVLSDADPKVEGLVFKAKSTSGFRDSSIIRCRKPQARVGARS